MCGVVFVFGVGDPYDSSPTPLLTTVADAGHLNERNSKNDENERNELDDRDNSWRKSTANAGRKEVIMGQMGQMGDHTLLYHTAAGRSSDKANSQRSAVELTTNY